MHSILSNSLLAEGNSFEKAPDNVSIILEELLCHGNEDGISNCAHAPYNSSDCRHWGDAGVVCTGNCMRILLGQPMNMFYVCHLLD